MSFELELARFASLDDEDLEELEQKRESVNTKKATTNAVKILRDYLAEKNMNLEFENMSPEELDNLLHRFYAEVRMKDGTLYTRSSLTSIRHGINRHLHSAGKTVDIVNGIEFKKSREMCKAVYKDMKRQGKAKVEPKTPIEEDDLKKIYEFCDLADNRHLQYRVFVDLMLHFGRRGRENLRELQVCASLYYFKISCRNATEFLHKCLVCNL